MLRLVLALAILVLVGSRAAAQPQVANGDVRQTAVTGALTRAAVERVAGSGAPAWVGYAVPAIDGDRRMCCWSGDGGDCCQGCRLEPGGSGHAISGTTSGPDVVRLEGRMLHVLFRVEDGRINRIRTFSDDCALDAGGRTLHWLTGVTAADSIAMLADFLAQVESRRLADGALTALAMHRDPAALERLLSAARDGATTQVRGQALFWLAQRAGDEAVGAITDAIARDPETDVKRRAVFALSQLPKDQGVPLLIDVARTNRNPAVRKQAIFWLGQSRDPRALKFFEEILFK